MKKATNPRNRIIIGLLFEGGLRVSELIGLNICDLKDINQGIVHIVKRDDPNNPDAAVKYNSIGDVFVSPALAKEINDFLNSSQGQQLKSKINSADKNTLLKEFQKIDPNTLNSKLKGMSKDDILKIINRL